MAGRLGRCRLCRILLLILTLALTGTVLVTTRVWNPLPQLAQWWNKFTTLSSPAPDWTARVGGVPDLAASLVSGEVVVVTRGYVEAYRDSGERLWTYQVHWALPAYDVVVARVRPANPDENPHPDRGYSVIDPRTGAVLWGDETASAVWAFADRILDLSCSDGGCELRARGHRNNGQVLWRVALPREARRLSGPNPGLLGTRDPAGWFVTAKAASPGVLPPVIALVVDGRVEVIDTIEGVRVRQVSAPDRHTRIAFSGERVLFSHAEPGGDAGCRLWIEAFDYRSQTSAWRQDGLDLDTARGAGCDQRNDPLGAGNYLVARRVDNRPTMLSAVDGRTVWTGVAGERVLATDGELAVFLAADRRTVRVVDLLNEDAPPVFTVELGVDPTAAVTRDFVIVRDGDLGRVIVLNRTDARPLLDVKTKATVIGYGRRGIILASGRRIGYLAVIR